MEEELGLLVAFGISVVMPVMIVWLVSRTRQNETNKKTEIMLKAIESGATIDADFFKIFAVAAACNYRHPYQQTAPRIFARRQCNT